jgi:tetratricopeptide (TPR) repeat protein
MNKTRLISLGVIVVSLWGCFGNGTVATAPTVPGVQARLAEAESLYRKGCYVPLKKAFAIYQELYANPSFRKKTALPFLKTCLVLSAREKDLQILDPARICLKTAEAITRTNRELAGFRTWIEVAALITPNARGVQTDIDTTFDWVKTMEKLLAEREALRSKASTDELLAFLYTGWNCTSVPFQNKPDDPSFMLARFPDSIFLRYQAAVCGQLPDRKALEALAAAEPEFYEARYHLGELNIREGVVLTAERELLGACAGIPESPQIMILLGSVYFATEEYDKGLEFYDRTLAVSPEYRDALLGKAVCLASLKRYEESIAVLDRMVALGYWLLGESNYWLAWNKHAQGRDVEALNDIDQAKGRLPTNSEVFALSGTLAFELDQADRAEKDFRESLRYNASSTESLFGLGNVNARNGKWLESAEFYEKASQVMDGSIAGVKDRITEIGASVLSEERKARLIQKSELKLQSLLYSRATAYFHGATSRVNAKDAPGARRLAAMAAEHPAYKVKAEELLKKLESHRP